MEKMYIVLLESTGDCLNWAPDRGVWIACPARKTSLFPHLAVVFSGPIPHFEGYLFNLKLVSREIL